MVRIVHTLLSVLLGSIMISLCLMVSQAEADEDIAPPDVFQLISAIDSEVEQIRWNMGTPLNFAQAPDVSNVSPHEVYFQTITLFDKADRLVFEQTHQSGITPVRTSGEIRPVDVYTMLEAARSRIYALGHRFDDFSKAELPPRDDSRTPTDVFQAVVQLNRQLNLMLEHRFSPSDVYRQVTMAGEYAISILTTFAKQAPPLAKPDRVLGKRPVDVYRRLKETYALVHELGKKMGRPMLTLNSWMEHEDRILPSDVYDVASLLVSELAYIYKTRPGAPEPRAVHRGYGKIPSDVYQRVEVLNVLLKEMIARSK